MEVSNLTVMARRRLMLVAMWRGRVMEGGEVRTRSRSRLPAG